MHKMKASFCFFPETHNQSDTRYQPLIINGRLWKRAMMFLLILISFPVHKASATPCQPELNKILPVKITSFTAKYNAERQIVSLHWVTVMEKNNEHFLIERSLDSLHFVVIGKARSSGNSHETQHYYFDDPKPVGGKIFYRLREIDSSGKQYLTTVISAYKPISTLELTGIQSTERGNRLNFAVISPVASSANVVVADISGHVLRSYFLNLKEGANLQSIFTGNLKAGVYFLQVNDKNGNGNVMEKFKHTAEE